MEKLILVLQTKLNENGDYQGFDYLSSGKNLLSHEKSIIERKSIEWYESSDLFQEHTQNTSIGKVTLRLFPNQVPRRKLVLGFLSELDKVEAIQKDNKDLLPNFNEKYFRLLEEAIQVGELPVQKKQEAIILLKILENNIIKNKIKREEFAMSMLSVFKYSKNENSIYLENIGKALIELITANNKHLDAEEKTDTPSV
jgi:hypothetical protein